MAEDIQLTRDFIAKGAVPELVEELALRGSGSNASVLLFGDLGYAANLAERVFAAKARDTNGLLKRLPVHMKVLVRDTGDATDPLTGEVLSPDHLRASLSAQYANLLRTAVMHLDGPRPTVIIVLPRL